MRRLLRGFSLALVLASSAIVAVGCGGLTDLGGLERLLPPGTFGGGSQGPFVGMWTLTSISVSGVSVNCPGTITNATGPPGPSCVATVRTFLSNGTFNDTAPVADSGTWSVTTTDLTMTEDGVVTTGPVLISADLSKFIITVGTESMTWTKHS